MRRRQAQKWSKIEGLVPCLLSCGLALFLSGSFSPSFADDATMSSNLGRLEDKYFQHDFSKDEVRERIDRLEELVYGEVRSGSNEDRVKNLMSLVPRASDVPPPSAAPPSSGRSSAPATPSEPASQPPEARRNPLRQDSPAPDYKSGEEPTTNENSYPAVTAIEKKLLGRDYVGESVGKRLDRLEIKAYGKTSASDDLQDRVDRLKSSTGIDVARNKPANSEWADEEEDPLVAGSAGIQPFTGISGDDPAGSRSYRKQQGSLARPRPSYDPYAGTGTFGAGGNLPSADGDSGTFGAGTGTFRGKGTPGYGPGSGSAGYGIGPGTGMPPAAPDFSRPNPGSSAPIPAPAMGVSQQISLLEREVFRRTYDKETILNRLSRLESTVFPQDKPASDKSLPDRMNRLLAAVPVSQASAEPAPARRRRGGDPDFPDLDFGSPGSLSSQAQRQPSGNPGGLSKIINGLGNMLGGGGGYSGSYTTTGNYATTPGHLVTDPSTGLLYDQYTGTLIDPMTGAVVGRRNVGVGGMGYPSYGGFNSGLSPMSPYGGMGFGGGGVRMGWP